MRRSLLLVLGLAFAASFLTCAVLVTTFSMPNRPPTTKAKRCDSSSDRAQDRGYDYWARILARYLPKYLSGNPAFVVQNMPGGGSLMAANYVVWRSEARRFDSRNAQPAGLHRAASLARKK